MGVPLLTCKKSSLYIRIQLLFLILGVAVALITLKDRKNISYVCFVFGCLTASYFIVLFWNLNVAFSCCTQIL